MVILRDLVDPKLIALIAHGAVGVLPTDTIYGLVASAHNPEATARLYRLKSREQKPGTIIAASAEQLIDLGIDESTIKAVAHLWPNPISIELQVPQLEHIHQGTGHGAFRVVADPLVAALLEQTGPLVTSSANHPGKPASTTIAEAEAYFGDSVDFYVDGGDRSKRPPSTVVRYEPDGTFTTLRQGAVNINGKGELIS